MADWSWRALVALLIWPGLAGGAVLSWLYLWMGRKLMARLQGRMGPPFYQPFFDFVKLLAKRTVLPAGVNRRLFYALPLVALASVVCALALIPTPGNPLPSWNGDLILLLYLLEMPALCNVLAGYVSRSIYGQVSAAREAVFSLGYNLPFLAAVVALAVQSHSFTLSALAAGGTAGGLAGGLVRVAAALAFLLALPARMKSNPFSIPNAEQEILAGTQNEYNAAPLAFFELAHGLELVALVELFAVLFLPFAGLNGVAAWVLYLVAGVVIVTLLTVVGAATARLKINQAFRFYWRWGAAAALLSLALSFGLKLMVA